MIWSEVCSVYHALGRPIPYSGGILWDQKTPPLYLFSERLENGCGLVKSEGVVGKIDEKNSPL